MMSEKRTFVFRDVIRVGVFSKVEKRSGKKELLLMCMPNQKRRAYRTLMQHTEVYYFQK